MVSGLTDSYISLGPNVAMSLVRQRQQTIRCVEDHLWLTQEGLTDDILLAPGQTITLRGRGRIVAQAVYGRARFVVSVSKNPARALRHALASLFYRLGDAVAGKAGNRAKRIATV